MSVLSARVTSSSKTKTPPVRFTPESITAARLRYSYAGLVLALTAALLAFLALWLLNGHLTARFLARLGLPLPLGWLVHILVSAVEQHLWRAKALLIRLGLESFYPVLRPGIYVLVFLFGLADVGSSSYEFSLIAADRGWPAFTLAGNTLWTILSEVIAIGSEPLLMTTGFVLWAILMRGPDALAQVRPSADVAAS